MKRYLSLYLPRWSIDLAAKRSAKVIRPLVLVTNISGQFVVRRCCRVAKQKGIGEGMSLALAKALAENLKVQAFKPESDFKKLYKLALWAFSFSPLVGIEEELVIAYKQQSLDKVDPLYNGLILDISGTEKLHKSEKALAQKILTKLKKYGICAKIATAPTIGAAWALARGTKTIFTTSAKEGLSLKLKSLPIAALRINTETIYALQELGLYNIEEVLALPRKELATRFGLALIKRLDQLYGHVEETLNALHPKSIIHVKRDFDVPLRKHASIQKAISMLLSEVFEKLARADKKSARFIIILEGVDNNNEKFKVSKEIVLNAATKNLNQISAILSPLVESLKIPDAVNTISLSAKNTEAARALQADYLKCPKTETAPQIIDEFLNNLILGLGAKAVSSIKMHQSYIPEKAFSFRPIENNHRQSINAELKPAMFDYPSYIFPCPEAAEAIALLPDKAPSRITWKGKQYTILQGIGPERITPSWWESTDPSTLKEREYYKVQDHLGRWLWVFRERDTLKWFVHGIWS